MARDLNVLCWCIRALALSKTGSHYGIATIRAILLIICGYLKVELRGLFDAEILVWSLLIFTSNTYSCVSPEVKTHSSGSKYNQNDCQEDGMPVLRDERDDLLSVTRGEVSQDHISGNSAKRECKQELFYWILRSS